MLGFELAYHHRMTSFKNYLTAAFILFFGGIFTAGTGLGLSDGIAATLLVAAGVLLAVIAPATALVGAAIEEASMAAVED